jgi:hypothetical protein
MIEQADGETMKKESEVTRDCLEATDSSHFRRVSVAAISFWSTSGVMVSYKLDTN